MKIKEIPLVKYELHITGSFIITEKGSISLPVCCYLALTAAVSLLWMKQSPAAAGYLVL